MAMSDRPRIEVRRMTADDVPVAASLLASRQRRLRASRPELPAAFTEASACAPLVAALLERPATVGHLLELDGVPAGYLAGFPRDEPAWGRACWSPIEGSALADGVPAEAMRDLYAAWSSHFVRRGFFLQYVHAAVDDPDIMAAWFRTGFGQMQAHAVRDLALTADPPAGVTVRHLAPQDIDLVDELLPLIALALARPPAYAMRLPEELASYRASWEEELSEPGAHHWLAEQDGRALAMASFYRAEPGPMVPDGAWELAVAMTRPEERGRGLVRALLSAGFAEARAAGSGWCITDWRTASLPTHRSWTALGFAPTHYRLHRHVDERIAWADGRTVTARP
jgi:GNAT superfamily N-acetyltransferase